MHRLRAGNVVRPSTSANGGSVAPASHCAPALRRRRYSDTRYVLPFARVDRAEPTLLTQEYAGSAVEVAAEQVATCGEELGN